MGLFSMHLTFILEVILWFQMHEIKIDYKS